MKIDNISLNTHNGKLPSFNKSSKFAQNKFFEEFSSVDKFVSKQIGFEIEKERNDVLKSVKTNFFKIGKSFQKII